MLNLRTKLLSTQAVGETPTLLEASAQCWKSVRNKGKSE